MPLLWILLGSLSLGIVAIEWVLWRLFRSRVAGLHLHLSSTTGRRLFTVMRIRICVILHTLFLLGMTVLPLFFLW